MRSERRRKAMKAASPLGGLLVAISVILIAIFGMVGWIGSYQSANNEPINPQLAILTNSIIGQGSNASHPSGAIFGSVGSSNSVSNEIIQTANNTKGIIGAVSAAASAAGQAFSFIGTIGNFFNPFSPNNFMTVFVTQPLLAAGVNATYAAFITYALVVAMIVLLIMSALLIFNLL